MPKVICIIPARGGSKGLQNKNIKKINGHPLIAYTISAAKISGVCDKIVVTTDSKKIREVALRYGAEVPFLRPKKYSGDKATTEETLKHALLLYEKKFDIFFSYCVYLTPTDLFRDPDWIKLAINIMKENNSLESCFVANKTHKNFWCIKNNSYKRILESMKKYSSRQQKTPIYREDTGLTCVSKAKIWRSGKRIGNKVKIISIDNPETNIDIHSGFDFFLAEQTIKYFKKNNPNKVPKIILK